MMDYPIKKNSFFMKRVKNLVKGSIVIDFIGFDLSNDKLIPNASHGH